MNTGFKYFPKKLYSKPVKMIAALSSAVKSFGMSRPSEIFYTIQNGNWNNPNVWETVSGRVGKLPTANDDVYIKHNIFIPSNIPMSCTNLFITGSMSATAQIFATDYAVRVFGNFKCDGVINGIIIWLYGNNTFINREKNPSSNQFIIRYASTSDQPIFPMDYFTLSIAPGALGVKYLTENTTCQSFSAGGGSVASLEIGPYDFTCFGTFTNYFLTSCSGNGYLLFIGAAAFHGRSSIIGAPTIEFRGGVGAMYKSGLSATGFGQILFTTNNQSFSNVLAELVDIDCPVTIGSGLSLTIASATVIQFNKIINGADGASSLINRATINFGTLESVASMTVGTFDRTTFANTVGYTGNYSATIPSSFNTFSSLVIGGSGTKTLGANTTINANLNVGVSGFGTLELSTLNLTVTGTTTFGSGGSLLKSGAGNLLFIGAMTVGASVNTLNFSGNPIVEFRGGITIGGFMSVFNTGTNSWNFTTSNQTINVTGAYIPIFSCTILIASGIVLTTLGNQATFNNVINGQSGTSSLLNRGIIYFGTLVSISSMTVGTFDRTSFANTVGYGGNYSATLPYSTYSSLVVSGTGTKTLGANTTLSGNLNVGSSGLVGNLQCSTFNLTVTGTSIVTPTFGFIAKNGPGSILFIGNFQPGNGAGQTDFRIGNPTVELRGGLSITNSNPNINTIYTGLGQWSFTTNNQSMTSWNTNFPINFDAPITIASGITLTVAASMYAQFSNTINGASVTSNLTNRGFIGFHTLASVSSMTTGTFDRTSFANTVGYTGNYSTTIPFATFWNLTISGTGTKTLGANTTLNGNLVIQSTVSATDGLDTSTFNLFVNGTSQFTTLTSTGAGDITFVGAVSLNNGFGQLWRGFNFGGNPNVEFRNGITMTNNNNLVMGGGNYTFTTNSQTLSITNANALFPNGTIIGAITLTFNANSGTNGFNSNPNGTVAGSTLRNQGTMRLNGDPSGVMSTGTFNVTTFATNIVIYSFNGNATIPLTTYGSLAIGGTGTKTLSGNTTILTDLSYDSLGGNLECSTFNLTVNGTFGGVPSAPSVFSKTGSGSLLFVGFVATNQITWILSGNPTIEFRAGLRILNVNTGTQNMGNGTITFSTNNQTLNSNNILTFNNPITISGAITLIVEGFAAAGDFTFAGVINGNNASSRLRAGTTSPIINYQNATQPMATGLLDTSTNLNTFIYGNGNQNIRGGNYRNLTFNGGGVKTLQGNVVRTGTYTLTPPATVNLNGFTLT
jgi:hypothetical protein